MTELIALEPAEVPDTMGESSEAADPNGQVAVGSLPRPGADPLAVVDEPPDNVWFEAPPPDTAVAPDTPDAGSSLGPAVVDGLPATPAPGEPPDHTVWAPPEDRA